MAIHPSFPESPYEILDPEYRWFPADESLRQTSYDRLMPPLVSKIRKDVKQWRDNHYKGASVTSIALLSWWFQKNHALLGDDEAISSFQYYFAQREAIETVIYLYEVAKVRNKFDLMKFDSS